MRGQALVAIADVAQHLIEAVDQKPDLLIGRLLDVHVVAMVLANLLHGAQQATQWMRDRPLKPQCDEQADRKRRSEASKVNPSVDSRRGQRSAVSLIILIWPTSLPPLITGTETKTVPLRSRSKTDGVSSASSEGSVNRRDTPPSAASTRPSGVLTWTN